ncbi:MAG: lactate utilization protein, partial [Proteobacteria bacterium]|nr:lactate utilization protein [Pseudomonadota bacterium]
MKITDDRELILQQLAADTDGTVATPLPCAPAMPTARGDLVAAYRQAATANQCNVARIREQAELPAVVATFLHHHQAPLQALAEEELLALPWQQAGLAVECRAPLMSDSCGITGVEAAAANNGCLLLTDNTPHRLTLSLTPPYHVAVVSAASIYADLPAVWQHLPHPLPRSCTLV